jgi:hypothetical protein
VGKRDSHETESIDVKEKMENGKWKRVEEETVKTILLALSLSLSLSLS